MARSVTPLGTHLWCLAAIIVNIGVVALITIVYKDDIVIPFPKNVVESNLENYLPIRHDDSMLLIPPPLRWIWVQKQGPMVCSDRSEYLEQQSNMAPQ